MSQDQIASAYEDTPRAVQMSAGAYKRLTIEDLALIVRLSSEGRTQSQIAAAIGCSQPSISYALQRFKTSEQEVQALLKAQSVDAAKAWGTAIEKAADRGDHRPARELIEAAYPNLRPTPANSAGGGGVTINIGTLDPPQVVIETSAIAPSPTPLSPSVSEDLHRLTVDSTGDRVA